jgi:hypothetical protein
MNLKMKRGAVGATMGTQSVAGMGDWDGEGKIG